MMSTSCVEECSGSSKIGGRVVKFKISEVCCSIRLLLRTFEPYNETFRQLKQIISSKLFSPLATLYDWNQQLCKYFFGSVDEIIKNKNANNTTGEMEVYSKLQK
jgi:hypothetical protein